MLLKIANKLSHDELKAVAFLTSDTFIKYSQFAHYGFRLLIALIYNLALGGWSAVFEFIR